MVMSTHGVKDVGLPPASPSEGECLPVVSILFNQHCGVKDVGLPPASPSEGECLPVVSFLFN